LREEDVDFSITVNVAQRDARALAEHAIPEEYRVADLVLERDARASRRQTCESGMAARDVEVAPAVSGLLMPRRRRFWAAAGNCRKENQRARSRAACVHVLVIGIQAADGEAVRGGNVCETVAVATHQGVFLSLAHGGTA